MNFTVVDIPNGSNMGAHRKYGELLDRLAALDSGKAIRIDPGEFTAKPASLRSRLCTIARARRMRLATQILNDGALLIWRAPEPPTEVATKELPK